MSFNRIKNSVCFFVLCIGLSSGQIASAFFPPILIPFLQTQKATKNLILILDVKMEEQKLGACGITLAAALKDESAIVITSAHTLVLVKEYMRPGKWNTYKNGNLVLLEPIESPDGDGMAVLKKEAGLNVDMWHKVEIDTSKGSNLAFLGHQDAYSLGGNKLSAQSTKIITQMLCKNKNIRWKIFAAGHGMPDAKEVCGLNLEDFRALLNMFEKDLSVDFLVYQTCFGGGPHQLKQIYSEGSGIFKKFSFPIISSALTNTISFASDSRDCFITFKTLFSKINHSVIKEKKMHRLLNAVNDISKGLDLACNSRMSNNLLLIRMAGSDFFEPVADNRFVFKGSEFFALDQRATTTCADENKFKCILIDKPIINATIDCRGVRNFMIASGISREKHYIKEILLTGEKQGFEEFLPYFANVFNSLGLPEKEKVFFIDTIHNGNVKYSQATIKQMRCKGPEGTVCIHVRALCNGACIEGEFSFKSQACLSFDQKWLSSKETKKYLAEYSKEVRNQLNKKHYYPFGLQDTALMA